MAGNKYRFGIAVDNELVRQFDAAVVGAGYNTRSEAIRDLMRQFVVERSAQSEERAVVGAVIMVYDHKKRQLPKRLTEYQHEHHDEVIATMHIHLDKTRCMEILATKGEAAKIKKIADGLFAQRGVLFGRLTIAAIDD